MKRAFIFLLDSVGIGSLPDAADFGDVGANTLRHIAEYCYDGKANRDGVRNGQLNIPNLTRLGINNIMNACNGSPLPDIDILEYPQGAYGYSMEISLGKDTTSGHWEIAGVPVTDKWGFFSTSYPSFPEELVNDFVRIANLPGILGNKHASGTTIINELGDEHIKTGKPIVYTSADSVFQIAAHEQHFGLDRLYEICKIARKLVDKYNIGRVIARPFLGESGNYNRTANRHDYSVLPTSKTLLDKLFESGGTVISIGKIADIYAHCGISKTIPADGNMALFNEILNAEKAAQDKTLVFANLIDFDMKFGHRRDVIGYAKALEEFDARIPEFEKVMQPGDIAVITADHGCDPTLPGSDHTREYIPILIFGPGIKSKYIGCRKTFADIGQTLAAYFDLEPFEYGEKIELF